tara:strand:+ start:798 stop:932 length:135 start_codon:yes stop_codon:yes gene_type:complete
MLLKDNGNRGYKVTKRVPQVSVAETKIFETLEEAQKQQEEWLSE